MTRRALSALVLIIAAVSALAGYRYFCYPASMLVLQVKTLEKGNRAVQVVDMYGGIHERRFEVGNDLGEPSYYTIDLPRTSPEEIRIDPLAERGKFEIDRITLINEDITYSWDSSGACTSKRMENGRISRSNCPDGPLLQIASDNLHQTISKIPRYGFDLNIRKGILAGIISFMVVVLAGLWLCRTVNTEINADLVSHLFVKSLWLLLLVLYFAQFYALWLYTVDIPFWEEWEYFLPDGLPMGLTSDWLFSFAGYHRVVFTKLMAWLNLQFFGLDFKLQKLFNYAIFAGLLLILINLKNRIICSNEFVLFPAFVLFLLSPIMYENHSNSYQSQIHLLIIFTLLAISHIYAEELRIKSLVIFILCLTAAINTFSAGMTIAAVLLPCWALYLITQANRGLIPWRNVWIQIVCGVAIISMVAVSWIIGYRQPSDCVWLSPFTWLFWDTILNLISFSFGFDMSHPLPGVICLLVVILPIVLLWSNKELRSQKRVWQLTTGILCILAILATISITRGNFVGTSKTSRYVEFGLILIPLTSIAWWLALARISQRFVVLALLWGACFISFYDNWSFSPYRDGGQMDRFVLEALEEYSLGRGDGVFPWSHPKPLPPFFEGARQLKVKFTRQFQGINSQDKSIGVLPGNAATPQ
jgi:hypothetical protein